MRRRLSDATKIGNAIISIVTDNLTVFRVIPVGEIRLQKPFVENVELLAIPIRQPVYNLWGEEVGLQNKLREFFYSQEHANFTFNGIDRNKKHIDGFWKGEKFRIYETIEKAWPVSLLHKTGPDVFTTWFFTKREHGGAMPFYYLYDEDDGVIKKWGEVVTVKTEKELFRLMGVRWVEPSLRKEFNMKSLRSLLLPIGRE